MRAASVETDTDPCDRIGIGFACSAAMSRVPREGEDLIMTTSADTPRAIPFSGESDTLPRTPLTQAQYTSPDWYRHDLEKVFSRRWLFAGHASQIRKAGEFFTFSLGHENVIVSRSKSGEIKAFHNVCRHRGTQVCQQTSGRAKYFTCPFHGWAYDLDGALKVAPMMPDSFDKEQFPLKRVWLEEWEGLIFLNLSPERPSVGVSETFANVDLSAFELKRTKVIADHTYEVQANWKITGETFQECYHCALTHPELVRIIKPETDLQEWDEVEPAPAADRADYLIWTPDSKPRHARGRADVQHGRPVRVQEAAGRRLCEAAVRGTVLVPQPGVLHPARLRRHHLLAADLTDHLGDALDLAGT